MAAALEEEHIEELDLSSAEVVTKYRMASDIVQTSLQGLLSSVRPGAKVLDLCSFGDTLIDTQCAKVYKNKKLDRGVAFPTCVSVNECVSHFSPLTSGDDVELRAGDYVKLDLGAHIDGFIAVAAHTLRVPSEEAVASLEETAVPPQPEVTGKAADVMAAAYYAAEVAARMIKPGNTNTQVTEAMMRVAEAFEVNRCQGVLMHQLKQFVIDGNKVALLREEPDQKFEWPSLLDMCFIGAPEICHGGEIRCQVEEETFEENEVYGVDVFMSSGDGKPTEKGTRTTVFKRAAEEKYRLKMKASRFVLNEVSKRFPTLPFTLRALGKDQAQARMGVTECVNHDLLHPYPVLYEKDGEYVAHFKFTVLLLPSGNLKITGWELPETVRSEKSLPEDLAELLKQNVSQSKAKKRKRAKKKGAAPAEA